MKLKPSKNKQKDTLKTIESEHQNQADEKIHHLGKSMLSASSIQSIIIGQPNLKQQNLKQKLQNKMTKIFPTSNFQSLDEINFQSKYKIDPFFKIKVDLTMKNFEKLLIEKNYDLQNNAYIGQKNNTLFVHKMIGIIVDKIIYDKWKIIIDGIKQLTN